MERVEKSIEVKCPVRTVYNQWTQFEEFPQFMTGVKEVKQLDDTHMHWHAEIWGKDKEWDSEIVEQVPDQRIAGVMSARVQNTVEDFKKFIESRGGETGAWRGEVHGGQRTS